MTAITWRQGGLAAQPRWDVGGAGRNCGALGEARSLLQRGNSSCIPGTAMREPSRGLSAHPDLEAQSGKSIPVTPPGLTSAFRLPENTPGGASLRTATHSIHRCIFKAHSPEALNGIILLLELCLLIYKAAVTLDEVGRLFFRKCPVDVLAFSGLE